MPSWASSACAHGLSCLGARAWLPECPNNRTWFKAALAEINSLSLRRGYSISDEHLCPLWSSSSCDDRSMVDAHAHHLYGHGMSVSEKKEWNLYQFKFSGCLHVAKITAEVDKNLLISSFGLRPFQRLYTLVQRQYFSYLTYKELANCGAMIILLRGNSKSLRE